MHRIQGGGFFGALISCCLLPSKHAVSEVRTLLHVTLFQSFLRGPIPYALRASEHKNVYCVVQIIELHQDTGHLLPDLQYSDWLQRAKDNLAVRESAGRLRYRCSRLPGALDHRSVQATAVCNCVVLTGGCDEVFLPGTVRFVRGFIFWACGGCNPLERIILYVG